jgi:CRP/FNR family transcriptional regulator, anaerobic regulatory protein
VKVVANRPTGGVSVLKVLNPVPCRLCPLGSCPELRPHSEEEIPHIQEFKTGEVQVERGEVVIEQDISRGGLYTVLEGMMMRYRSLADGRRQIVNFMFPGDLVGLQAAFGETATHSVEALRPSRLCIFNSPRYFDIVAAQPRLAYDITWLAAKEESALEEHLVALGQRSARERVTYLAVWLLQRARGTCVVDSQNRLEVTITQTQIADMLGLSLVHTNRTIKGLERSGEVLWRQNSITIPDLAAAAELAHYDSSQQRPRPYL